MLKSAVIKKTDVAWTVQKLSEKMLILTGNDIYTCNVCIKVTLVIAEIAPGTP